MNSKREVSVISFYHLEKSAPNTTEWVQSAVVAISDSFLLDRVARDWATDVTSLSEGMVIVALREVERQRDERRASRPEARQRQSRKTIYFGGDTATARRSCTVRTGHCPDILSTLPESTPRDLATAIGVLLDKESCTVAYAKNLITDLASLSVYDGMETTGQLAPFVGGVEE
jgi:hypothetical protein